MAYYQGNNPFKKVGEEDPPTIAGQWIERSSKGMIAIDHVGDIKKGDVIHGVTKYIGKSGEIPGDLDFTYRKSTRKSGGWTITGHK